LKNGAEIMDMMIEVLSIHFTTKCNFDCPFCYIHKSTVEKDVDWFCDLIKAASEYNIPQIAIGGGEPLLFPKIVTKLAKTAKHCDMNVSLTTNGSIINSEVIESLEYVDLVSVSVDHHKVKSNGSIRNISSTIDSLSNLSNFEVGVNYLILDKIALGIMPLVFNYLKTEGLKFYALQPKFYELNYGASELKRTIKISSVLFDLYVDESIALEIGKIEECGCGRKIISVFPDGSISPCSFSSSIAKIEEPYEILNVIDSYYPMKSYSKCPYIIRRIDEE